MIGEIPNQLTPKQVEVLELVANGYLTKQVADIMGLSYHTVRGHVYALRQRLRAGNTTEAVAIGFRRKIIE